jgi:hypothetical protein
MYIAIVVAAMTYQFLGSQTNRLVPDMNEATSYFLAFLFLFISLTLGFGWILYKTTSPVTRKSRFRISDNVGGATLSIVVATVAVTLALAITVVMLQAAAQTSAAAGQGTVMAFVNTQVINSELAPVFLRLLPYISDGVRPWFPGGVPPILTSVEA